MLSNKNTIITPDDTIPAHEFVVLAGVIARPAENYKWLYKLIEKNYKFSEDYESLSKYLIDKSFDKVEGINKLDLQKQVGINDEQWKFALLTGNQEVKPSFDFLIENKNLVALQDILNAFNARARNKPATKQDFETLKYDLDNAASLREFKTSDQITDNLRRMVDEIHSGKTKLFKTGFTAWDNELRGINPEDLIVLGAYSGVGKTHLAIQIALSVLRDKGRVMYVSAENSEEEIKTRFGSHIAKEYETSLFDVGSERCLKLIGGINEITDRYYDSLTLARMSTFEDILSTMKARSIADRDDLYVLDYIQLFRSEKKYSGEREQLADFSSKLVEFVGKFKKPVLVLSQLVQGETESFKGAQDLLNMATIAGWMFKKKEYEEDSQTGKRFHRVKVDFKKVRRGRQFTIYGKVLAPDPDIHENFTESLELWEEIEPKRKY